MTRVRAELLKSKGFPRGTLIHTPGGAVPIEMLKAGYMVLSRAPTSCERAELPVVRPITSVQVHLHTPILRVEYERPGDSWLIEHVTVAPGQPLFTLSNGWIWAGRALRDWKQPMKLVTVSGLTVYCAGQRYVRATHIKDIGWIQLHTLNTEGALWDYRLNMLIEMGRMYDAISWGGERYARYGLPEQFRTTTYSIEVEDHHTFFAGPHGVLMGDSSCARDIAGQLFD